MTLGVLCIILRNFRAKSVGAVSKNVFCKKLPHSGARRGPCEKSGVEVVVSQPRSVCAKFGIDRANSMVIICKYVFPVHFWLLPEN